MSHFGKPDSATLQKSTLDKINAVITVDSDERVSERRMQRICLKIPKQELTSLLICVHRHVRIGKT